MTVAHARHLRVRPISFHRMIRSVATRYGNDAAVAWTKAVVGHTAALSERALMTALRSGNLERIAAVVRPFQLQQRIQQAVMGPLSLAQQVTGRTAAAMLTSHGLSIGFNAANPRVVLFARQQAAKLVVGVPAETRMVIAEVIAQGARGLTIQQQAKAIREVVGLQPGWAGAPSALAEEIRAGQLAAATARRIPYRLKQEITRRIADDTVTEAFLRDAAAQYAESLITRRALTIAHTETLRAANHGVVEGWQQATEAGQLPDTARKFWIVTPDDKLSDAHATIPGMNPDGRAIDEDFETTEGPYPYPPSRPNCRCSVGLVIRPRDVAPADDTPDDEFDQDAFE